MKQISVVFVCLGNICRSPLAAGVFRDLVAERGLEKKFRIESRGTGGWHAGEKAHPETRRVAKERGVSLEEHRAKQVKPKDFDDFDLIIAMDRENYRDLLKLPKSDKERVVHLREYDDERDSLDVPDPYYGGIDGFHEVHDIVERSCRALLEELVKKMTDG